MKNDFEKRFYSPDGKKDPFWRWRIRIIRRKRENSKNEVQAAFPNNENR